MRAARESTGALQRWWRQKAQPRGGVFWGRPNLLFFHDSKEKSGCHAASEERLHVNAIYFKKYGYFYMDIQHQQLK